MQFNFNAGMLFDMLHMMAEKPLPKGTACELQGVASIAFPTDEEASNRDLQEAAWFFADSLLDLAEARGRVVWGEPLYRLTAAEGEEMPAWIEDLPRYPNRLVGWRRGKTRVAFICWEQESKITPVNVDLGVVHWRAGMRKSE